MDFPVHDLDLSKYIGSRGQQISNHYRLYAISNHYGSMGGGHYTAYVYVSVLSPTVHFLLLLMHACLCDLHTSVCMIEGLVYSLF